MTPKGWEAAYFTRSEWAIIIAWSVGVATLLQYCSTWWHS